MAAKDTEPYIGACIESVLKQTYENWELVVVNDHSSDSTPQIISKFASGDSRIKLYHSTEHKLIPALRLSLHKSHGDLINRMDSDDLMPADKLQVLVNAWKQYGIGTVIAGGTQHFTETGIVGDGFRRYENWLNNVAKRGLHLQEIYRECVIPSHSWVIHKSDLKLAGGFDSDTYPEDYDLCFRFYRAGLNIVGIDHILHHWRDREDRISRTWECYRDNRYFELKVDYFYQIDRDSNRPLVVWGAGKNGKDLVKLLKKREDKIHWLTDNPKKVGKNIYDIELSNSTRIHSLDNPQIIIAVTSPSDQEMIELQLTKWGKTPIKDYWYFL